MPLNLFSNSSKVWLLCMKFDFSRSFCLFVVGDMLTSYSIAYYGYVRNTGVARNFDLGGGEQNRKILWRYFGDVFQWRNGDYVTKMTEFLKFNFVIISLKNHNFVKLRNFSSPKLKIKGRWGRIAPSAWRFFENLLLK